MTEENTKKTIDTGITPFAATTFRNKDRVFGIKTDDRRRHVYLIGKTGMGKTTLIENMVYSDIVAGHGVCYVDPHGDTAEKMLEWIPSNRINDVIYFNPADLNYPISFNVLEKVAPEYRHLVSSGLIAVFKKLWADSWGPRLEYILRHAIMALLEYPDSTLLGINRMLIDKEYNKKVVSRITDPVVKAFWTDEYPKWNERVLQEVISPIQNKVGQFLATSLIRNVVGQVKSSVNLRKIMDDQKILILNLSKGRIGEDASALLGAMMVTKIQLAAMSRVDIPEEDRKDFYLYVDEFQNFAVDSFADILSEARKYRLNLIIAHQYIEQLGEVVQPAVFGNVGTIICFRVGAADAEFLEKEFMPYLTQEDLVNLPKFNIYLKLMIDGVASEPFSAKGLPPVYSDSMGNEEKVINISRERYSKPKDIVEDKIVRWSESKGGGGSDEGARTADGKLDKNKIKGFLANCNNCETEIDIPFQPDGVRPVFCKECLKKARRGEIQPKPVKKQPEIEKEKDQPVVPLNQLDKKTVNFKGKSTNNQSIDTSKFKPIPDKPGTQIVKKETIKTQSSVPSKPIVRTQASKVEGSSSVKSEKQETKVQKTVQVKREDNRQEKININKSSLVSPKKEAALESKPLVETKLTQSSKPSLPKQEPEDKANTNKPQSVNLLDLDEEKKQSVRSDSVDLLSSQDDEKSVSQGETVEL